MPEFKDKSSRRGSVELKELMAQLLETEQKFYQATNDEKVSGLSHFVEHEKQLLEECEQAMGRFRGKEAPALRQEVLELASQAHQWHEKNQKQIQVLAETIKQAMDKNRQALTLVRQYQATVRPFQLRLNITG